MKKIILYTASLLVFMACDTSIKPIQYGRDQCDYCSMGIVQKTHSAQLVTSKGKQRKFDAIECMVNYIEKDSQSLKDANLWVANYTAPGQMIPAKEASYLISKNLPSPMGAYLTAFKNEADALKTKKQLEGSIHHWGELPEAIKKDVYSK
ncbi:nitrous oxide reductase accessory protein NosL [Psychroflexus tropicus]|uniref:nitrous oxide reductase accessory protein NosL n=1 Tax=Psychroflexus tropicus TaxID=197345 RepID=UPI000477010C|nr:nitrous oxide reductase accessory protein NosL [Psychroflexus tropicus]